MITIGEILSTIGLFFTFSQFLPFAKKIEVQYRYRQFFLAGLGAIACVLYEYAFSFCEKISENWIGYPSTWNTTAIAFLLAGVIPILYDVSTNLKFSKRNAGRILKIVTRVIGLGDENAYSELAEQLTPTLGSILKCSAELDTFKRYKAKQEGKEYKISEATILANKIFLTLSDVNFCRVVGVKNPNFIKNLYVNLKRDLSEAKQVLQHIIAESINNKNSILYREQSYFGLGYRQDLSKLLFSNHTSNDNFYPLSSWTMKSDNVDPDYLNCFSKCFLECFENYLLSSEIHNKSFSIEQAGKILVETPSYLLLRIHDVEKNVFSKSAEYKCYDIVVDSLIDLITKVAECEQVQTKAYMRLAASMDEDRDYTVFALIADWTFELLETAAIASKFEKEMRFSTTRLWTSIYSLNTPTYMEIRKRLDKLIQKRIEENFKDWYAPMTRLILYIMGLNDRFQTSFHASFINQLATKFIDIYVSDPEKALQHLPSDFKFEIQDSKIIDTRNDAELILQNDFQARSGDTRLNPNSQ